MTSSSPNGIDLTERRRAEEPLRESEAKFRDKADAAQGDHEDVLPQDRNSSVAHSIEVPPELIRKWQEFVNLLAEIMHVPSASIMRADPPHIKVLVSSTSNGNPCEPGALDTGPYCETVMKTGQPLLVPDARENEAWKTNPHVGLGIISYLGVPIGWPDGRLFGTICVRDKNRNEYSEAYLKLLLHFRDILQADLKSLVRLHGEIEEREAKIRRLVDANIIGIFIWDFDGRILEANEAFLDIVGYDHEDLVAGRVRWTALTPPEGRDRDMRLIEEHKVTGTLQPFEKEYFRKDGSRVPVLMGVATFEEGGNQGVAFVLDLTERKRAEEGLRESEYKLRQIIETVPGLIWSADPAGEPTQFNQRMLDYSGMQFEGYLQGGWEALLHPADFPETAKAFYHAIQTGTSFQAVHRLRRADGEFRWHHSCGEPLRDRQGRIIQWYGLSVDIDEAKKAEDRLRRSEAYLAEAQRLSHTGTWVLNPTTMQYLYWSDESYRIWGFDPLQGLPSREALWQRVDDRDRVWENVQEALRQKKNYSGEFKIVLPNGTVKYVAATFEHLFSTNGEIVEVIGTVVDVTEHKLAEQALREREAKIRRLVDANIIGIAIWDLEGRIIETNDAFLRMVDYDREDIVSGRIRWTELTPSEWRERDERVVAELRSSGTFQPFEKEYFRKDGSRIPVLIGGALFEESGGEGVAFVLDLTKRKCAEQALRESEAKFRDYAETASDWFWETGPDYKFTLLTENAFGSRPADRIGTACWDHALDLETEPEKWRLARATLDSRKPFRDFVYCALGGNGFPMYVRDSGKPMFDANGEFRGYRGTGTDVTAITRAQETLRESERSLRLAIDRIAGLVAVLAPNGELEAANRQLFEYFGRSLEELKNWGANDTVHPEDLRRILELVKRGVASEIPFNFELRVRRFDGEYRWFENRHVPILDDSGRIARWYLLLTDIEDRTRALARLDKMQSDFAHMNRVNMMGELAASLSHEITQPIASARNNARAAQNFLDMQPPDLGEVREALSGVVGDTDRAGDMIDRIRDQIKKAPPRKDDFDLNEAINEVIVLGRSATIKNAVAVETRLSEGLLPIHGDRVQLQQVILNLLLNAAEAMGSSAAGAQELLISTEQDRAGVLVAVRDSGPGLDPSHLERVFDAFYTTKSSGMGMGLSICRSIIEAHGGRLWAEANEPRGAVFQFTLPAAP
jgi:PAS domain S-box-containing protein